MIDSIQILYIHITRSRKSGPDDDRILDAALEAQADRIVPGDKHLRCLELWHGMRIVSPAEFIVEIE